VNRVTATAPGVPVMSPLKLFSASPRGNPPALT
jgi:hypothetical protein